MILTADRVSTSRALGWGASVVLHGGAAAFLLFGVHAPEPPPVVMPLEISTISTAPVNDLSEPSEASEPMESVVAEPVTAEPPPLESTEAPELVEALEPPEAVPAEPPPETAPAEPEVVEATTPEVQQPPEPETAPILEAELPPPPPPAPPPPQQAVRPPPPRPAPPRREPQVAAPAAPRPQQQTTAPPAATASAPAQAAAPAPVARRLAGPPPSYVARLSVALERAKRYPNSARLRRQEGVATLRFQMRRDGSVIGWRIERSTGFPQLDEAVGEMIERASPLPRPPEEMAGEILEMVVPVRFNLR